MQFRMLGKVRLAIMAVAVSILALILLLYRPDPFQAQAVRNPPFTSLTYGIQAFLWWDENYAAYSMDWTRLMVFSHVKQIFAWEDIEPRPGEFDFTRADGIVSEIEAKGLELVVRLTDSPDWSHPSVTCTLPDCHDAPPDDYADYGRYCAAIAERYRGRIAAYQVWNEPNLAREWGGREPNPAAYVGLLKVCYEAIKAVDPAAIVISAGLAPTGNWDATAWADDIFVRQMYDAGVQQVMDVLGVNAPGYNLAPEVSPDEAQAQGFNRFGTFRRVEDIRQIMVERGDAARQMAILEMGWTTDLVNENYRWFAVSPEVQADYFVRAYRYAAENWRPWMGLMSAIYIPDPSWTEANEEYWWAITLGSGGMGESFVALANMEKVCGERIIPARDPGSPEALGLATVVPCS
jgi:polysaccharide biosynthesis protein PslG